MRRLLALTSAVALGLMAVACTPAEEEATDIVVTDADVMPPPEMEPAPADAEMAPVEGEVAPVEGEVAPVEGEEGASEGEAPAVEEAPAETP